MHIVNSITMIINDLVPAYVYINKQSYKTYRSILYITKDFTVIVANINKYLFQSFILCQLKLN